MGGLADAGLGGPGAGCMLCTPFCDMQMHQVGMLTHTWRIVWVLPGEYFKGLAVGSAAPSTPLGSPAAPRAPRGSFFYVEINSLLDIIHI